MCHPFAHAISGRDTTSALFSIGNIKVMKALQESQKTRSDVLIFRENEVPKDELWLVGEQFVKTLYSGGTNAKGLNELRYLHFISPKYVPVERMPPTSRACYFHCLRVHHQVRTWINLKTVLDKEEYPFKIENGSLLPVIRDMAPAPEQLLLDIRCSRKSGGNLCSSCSCSKKACMQYSLQVCRRI